MKHYAHFVVTLLGVLIALVAAFFPAYVHDGLARPMAWGTLILVSFGGWGTLVVRTVARPRVVAGVDPRADTLVDAGADHDSAMDWSLRAVVGASGLLAVGGLLACLHLASRWPLLGLIVAGVGLCLHYSFRNRERRWLSFSERVRRVRRTATPTLAWALVGCLMLVAYAGAATDLSSTPYDDDLAYYPFVRQLIDAGTLLDPYSFRRLSALGGQTFFHALLGVNLDVLQLNLFDRGMCVVWVVALLAGIRVEGRKPRWFFTVFAAVIFLLLKNTSINSASYYSGVVFFLALFRSAESIKARDTFKSAIRDVWLLGLVGGATCTLRQNYIAVVAVFEVFTILSFYPPTKGRWPRTLKILATLLGFNALMMLPWMVLLMRSSATPFWPLIRGNFTIGASIISDAITPAKQVVHTLSILLGPDPIKALPLLMFAALFTKGARAKPLIVWVASVVGVLALSITFSLSDATNIARYDYGFCTAAVFFTWQRLGASKVAPHDSARHAFAVCLYLAGLSYQVMSGDSQLAAEFLIKLRGVDEQMRQTIPFSGSSDVRASYTRMQASVPAGATLLVLTDEPYGFNFARNRIWNLDMPGLAGPAPGYRAFRGPDALAQYFIASGARYLAFVEQSHSVHMFRKEIWFEHLYDRDEVWRNYAPYLLDTLESVEALGKSRLRLYEGDGMIVVDLTLPAADSVPLHFPAEDQPTLPAR